MNILNKHKVIRNIISNQRFLQLKYISMAIDTVFDKNRKEDRYSHSIQVANACEIMNDCISEKVGFLTDYKNTSYIVGLLHDIGHTAGGHEGERILDKMISEYSNGELFYDSNANNYVVIERENVLEDCEDIEYILASLAKHPDRLYDDQKYIKGYIERSIKEDIEYLNINGLLTIDMKKTLQCQIMDIADENCYTISDILDARNIYNNYMLAKFIRKEVDKKFANKLISSLYKSKKHFEDYLQEIFLMFCDNYTLKNGSLEVTDKDIELLRQSLLSINKKYVLNNKKIKKVRNKISTEIKIVFKALLSEEIEFPSKSYKNEIKKASSEKEKNILKRNMLGSFTDKAIKKITKRIK